MMDTNNGQSVQGVGARTMAGLAARSSVDDLDVASRLGAALEAQTRAHQRDLARIWQTLCAVQFPESAVVVTADAIVRRLARMVPQTWVARSPDTRAMASGDTPERAARALADKLGATPTDAPRLFEARCSDGRRAIVLVGSTVPMRVVMLP